MEQLGAVQRQKQKPMQLSVRKISNGYLISPMGLYSNDITSTEVYIASLENVPEALDKLFNTEV